MYTRFVLLLGALLAISFGEAAAQWKSPAPLAPSEPPAWPTTDPPVLAHEQVPDLSVAWAERCASRPQNENCAGNVIRFTLIGALSGVLLSVGLLPICLGASLARGEPACNTVFVALPVIGGGLGLASGLASPDCRER